MSTDNNNNSNSNPNNSQNNQNNEMHRQRRGSVTQQAIAGLFRSSSTSAGAAFPTATSDAQRRRLSVSTGLGLTGTSPTGASAFNSLRRGSLSTNSNDSIDENAIDEEDLPPNARTAPTTPFTRRMSFGAQAMRSLRNGGGSPGSNGNNPPASTAHSIPITPASSGRRSSVHNSPRGAGLAANATPPNSSSSIAAALASARRRSSSTAQASNAHRQRSSSDVFSRPDQGFNWSEQLRSRAESSVQGPRPSFSFGSGLSSSPPRGTSNANHDRNKSVSEMPAPPVQAAAMKPKAPERPKPDAFQERILKGDFYMD